MLRLAFLQRVFRNEAASGALLLLAALAALAWANSPFGAGYEQLWHSPLGIGSLRRPLHFWINDGLMAVFFLAVGLEIRHELHEGALANLRQASLPLLAAVGGVAVPALIYLALNVDPQLRRGWAVPTATDIAFAVGVLALLGRRVPPALRVLLLAIAIVDDIVAILVIAFFYSQGIGVSGLLVVAAGLAGVLAFQKLGIRSAFAYVLPGAAVWLGLLMAGVHPALAGVLLGLLTPVASENAHRDALPPVVRVERALHPWVTFGIMPLFALANAGVNFDALTFDSATTAPLMAGIVAGLAIGKPLGIFLIVLLSIRLGLCALPAGVGLKGILVVGCLAGIGFTLSIFICDLAFSSEALLASAKLAVLIASAAAAAAGLLAGRWMLKPAVGRA